jgi:hypothetical protein
MIINQANLNDALGIIIKDDSIFERLKTDFPEILADLTTFKTNPNCTCRARVVKYFSDKLVESPDLLDRYITNIQDLNTQLSAIYAQRIQNNYTGKVFTVGKTEADWQAFSNSLAGKMYRSFSVMDNGENLTVYML